MSPASALHLAGDASTERPSWRRPPAASCAPAAAARRRFHRRGSCGTGVPCKLPLTAALRHLTAPL